MQYDETFESVRTIMIKKAGDGYLVALDSREVPLEGVESFEFRLQRPCAMVGMFCDLDNKRTRRQCRVTFSEPQVVRVETTGNRVYVHIGK